MKKVLFVIGNLQLGGAERVLVDILNNIYDKFDIDLLLIEKHGPQLELLNENINIKYLTKSPTFCKNKISAITNKIYRSLIYRFLSKSKLYSAFVYKLVLKKQYDVEIGFLTGVPTDIIRKKSNKNSKKIMWIHSDLKDASKKFINLNKKTYKEMDHIVGISEESTKQFVEKFPDSKDKIIEINNYIDINKINTNADKTKNPYKSKKNNVLLLGRLVDVKGFDRVLEIASTFDDIMFNIVGDGVNYNKYNNYIKENKIKNVKLWGAKINPYPFIKYCDLFLVSSYSEAYPTVIVEALILNKPIITTDVAGAKDILDGYNNYLIVENSKSGISNGLQQFLSSNMKNIKGNSSYSTKNEINLNKIIKLIEK